MGYKNGHDSTTQMLLEKGADFNSEDNYHWTPFLWATENSHEGVTNLFIDKGADFDLKDHDGQSTLLSATQKGYDNIIEVLLEKGGKFDLKGNRGLTPLSRAVNDGHVFIVKALPKRSTFNLMDNHGSKVDSKGRNRKDVPPGVTLQQKSQEREVKAYLALALSDFSDDRAFAHELVFKEGQIMEGSFHALVERPTAYKSNPDATFVSTFLPYLPPLCDNLPCSLGYRASEDYGNPGGARAYGGPSPRLRRATSDPAGPSFSVSAFHWNLPDRSLFC